MKLIFIGGVLDHITLPLCLNFYEMLGSEFAFVSTRKSSNSRTDLGYGSLNDKYDFVIKGYEDEKKAIDEINKADIVIFGSAPENYAKKRMLDGKLTFRFTERLYKEPFTIKNFLYRYISAVRHHGIYQNKQVYVLCAGAYATHDFNRFGNYKGRCFKWCYFTEVSDKKYDELLKIKENNSCVELIWTARFVELKHPELVVMLAKYLQENSAKPFHITMIGGGDKLEDTKQLADKTGVSELITFTGPIDPEVARGYMEKADISLFTSDRLEGWGAVVNEAMGSGCATLASSAAGSSPFLIDDEENGLLFDIDDVYDFYSKALALVNDKERQRELGAKAYDTVQNLWTAENAAKNFMELANSIQAGKIKPAEKGPCSIAPNLKDGWYSSKWNSKK